MRTPKYQLASKFRYLDVFFEVTSTKFAMSPAAEWPWSDKKCTGCFWVGSQWRPRPIDVLVPEVPRGVGGLLLVGLAIYRTTFLNQLGHHLDAHVLGRCQVENAGSTSIDRYMTVYALNPLVVRSSPPKRLVPKYWECPVCHTVCCSPPQPPKCVAARDVQGREVQQTKAGVILISKRIADSLDWSGMSDASLEPVYVVETPFDHVRLPHDPEWNHS